jgi:hypothetical protein
MLANPVTVLIDLKDALSFAPEQVAKLEAVSDSLQEKLVKRRADLGSRFDGIPPQQQAQLFQQIMPEIEDGRNEIRAALGSAETILTPEQWAQVPAAVKDPFTPQNRGGRQGGQGGDGGGRPPGSGGSDSPDASGAGGGGSTAPARPGGGGP